MHRMTKLILSPFLITTGLYSFYFFGLSIPGLFGLWLASIPIRYLYHEIFCFNNCCDWGICQRRTRKLLYKPDYVSPPGDTLLDILEERNIGTQELSMKMGRTLKEINGILNGTVVITHEIAIDIDRALEVPADFWVKRDKNYRERL